MAQVVLCRNYMWYICIVFNRVGILMHVVSHSYMTLERCNIAFMIFWNVCESLYTYLRVLHIVVNIHIDMYDKNIFTHSYSIHKDSFNTCLLNVTHQIKHTGKLYVIVTITYWNVKPNSSIDETQHSTSNPLNIECTKQNRSHTSPKPLP